MSTTTSAIMRRNSKMLLQRCLTTAFICSILSIGNLAAAPMDEGISAYLKGNYKKSLAIWEPLAAQGNAEAQYWLGSLYFNGQGGVLQDYKVAMKLASSLQRRDIQARNLLWVICMPMVRVRGRTFKRLLNGSA